MPLTGHGGLPAGGALAAPAKNFPGRYRFPLLCLGLYILLLHFPLPAQAQDVIQYAEADIVYGSQIYSTQCSECHGVTGDSVSGVNFRAGQFRVPVSSDEDLRSIITTGVSGTGMPPFKFDTAELAGIVAYLRSMSAFDVRSITLGDRDRGRELFNGKGNCGSCHRVNGKGPRVAPDLSDIGAIRTADLLERTLLDPDSAMLPHNRSVRAVTREGKVFTGRRINEDTYTVQIIDDQEHLVSLVKADLRSYTISEKSSMQSYKGKLTPKEIADILAYLVSLKGSK
jgi:putative heme-binding domain-containing protein